MQLPCRKKIGAIGIAVLALPALASAASGVNSAHFTRRVHKMVRTHTPRRLHNLSVSIPSVTLPCHHPSLSWKGGSSAAPVVGFRCPSEVRFLTIHVQAKTPVVEASRQITAGHIVKPNAVVRRWVSLSSLQGNMLTTRKSVIGKKIDVTLAAGQPLRAGMLSLPDLVKSGMGVTLLYKQSGLTLSTHGVALQSGARGKVVMVRNSRTHTVVKGQVVSNNTVEVD